MVRKISGKDEVRQYLAVLGLVVAGEIDGHHDYLVGQP